MSRFVLNLLFVLSSSLAMSSLNVSKLPICKMPHTYQPNCDMRRNGELQILKSLISEDSLVFDVGANKGEWSKLALNRTRNSVFAFEPSPLIFSQLKEIRAPNFFPVNAAISNAIGEAPFIFYPNNSALSGFYDREILKEWNFVKECINVKTTTISEICREYNIAHIDFLKIDVEGHELFVLEGALEMMKAKRISCVQFEYGGCNVDSKTTLYELYSLLQENDFAIFFISPKGVVQMPEWKDSYENYTYSNYLAIKKDLLN